MVALSIYRQVKFCVCNFRSDSLSYVNQFKDQSLNATEPPSFGRQALQLVSIVIYIAMLYRSWQDGPTKGSSTYDSMTNVATDTQNIQECSNVCAPSLHRRSTPRISRSRSGYAVAQGNAELTSTGTSPSSKQRTYSATRPSLTISSSPFRRSFDNRGVAQDSTGCSPKSLSGSVSLTPNSRSVQTASGLTGISPGCSQRTYSTPRASFASKTSSHRCSFDIRSATECSSGCTCSGSGLSTPASRSVHECVADSGLTGNSPSSNHCTNCRSV